MPSFAARVRQTAMGSQQPTVQGKAKTLGKSPGYGNEKEKRWLRLPVFHQNPSKRVFLVYDHIQVNCKRMTKRLITTSKTSINFSFLAGFINAEESTRQIQAITQKIIYWQIQSSVTSFLAASFRNNFFTYVCLLPFSSTESEATVGNELFSRCIRIRIRQIKRQILD